MKFKKIIPIFFIIFLSLNLLSCRRRNSEKQENTLEKIRARGEFIIGLDDSFPPMGYRAEDGSIVGFDIDLANEVAKNLNVKLKPQAIDWNAKEMELSSGNIDCIWNGFTITEEREKNILFSVPYLENKQVYITLKNSPINSEKDLVSKEIGLQIASSGANVFQKTSLYGKNTTIEYANFLTALTDLKVGGIDVILMDSTVAGSVLRLEPNSYKIFESSEIEPEKYAVGFRKTSIDLKNEIDRVLADLAKTGRLEEIAKKYGILI